MEKDVYKNSIEMHKRLKGKLEICSKIKIKNKKDLSLAYTPGVAGVCNEIYEDKNKSFDLTMKGNSIAIVSDGSAVLGLGNIGPEAAIPVMEGKAILFKEFANIDAFPLCINTQNSSEIISFVKNIAPNFSGINLEDISAPRCFEIENSLQEIGIPVFHDDQHGTAIVVLAALINSVKIAKKEFSEIKVVINGAGAAGNAILNLLKCVDCDSKLCKKIKEVIVCDSKGIISKKREDLNEYKKKIINITNSKNISGDLGDAIKNADVFIGVSKGNILTKEMIESMNSKPIIFAMANPIPEIMPDKAKEYGAFIVGTGRSDYPNQINNLLAFPGIFRGAIDGKAKKITNYMKLSAALSIANSVKHLSKENIIPSIFEKKICDKVAKAVKESI
jgi:malate dehydrogenase (oxaloacetate-decarboxylating)